MAQIITAAALALATALVVAVTIAARHTADEPIVSHVGATAAYADVLLALMPTATDPAAEADAWWLSSDTWWTKQLAQFDRTIAEGFADFDQAIAVATATMHRNIAQGIGSPAAEIVDADDRVLAQLKRDIDTLTAHVLEDTQEMPVIRPRELVPA